MRGRQVGVVLIALIALGLAGLGVRLFSAEPELELISGVRPITEDVVDRVVIRDQENETTLRKINGQWWAGSETYRYPAVQIKQDEFWEVVSRIDDAELISKNPENHALMGLTEEQGTWVEFYKGGELQEVFFVGDKVYAPLVEEEKPLTPWTVQARLCYLKRQNEDKVYAVYCQFPSMFDPDHQMWSDPIVAAIPREDVESVTFSYPEGEFDLKVVRSVWVVADVVSERQASIQTVQGFLEGLEQVVTSDFTTEEDVSKLDFGKPNASIGIGTRLGATSRPVLLLFIQREFDGDGQLQGYYVKDAEKPYVYILNQEQSEKLLIRKDGFLAEPTPQPTPTGG